MIKSVNFKAYNVSSTSNLPVITAESHDTDGEGEKFHLSATQQFQQPNENEDNLLLSSTLPTQKYETIDVSGNQQSANKSLNVYMF